MSNEYKVEKISDISTYKVVSPKGDTYHVKKKIVWMQIIKEDMPEKDLPWFIKILASIDAFLNLYPYIPLVGYTLIFTMLSFLKDDRNIFCFYFSCLSSILFIVDHHIKRKEKRNIILIISFIVVLFLTVISLYFEFDIFRGIFSNIVSGILLIISIVISCIANFKNDYHHFLRSLCNKRQKQFQK